MKKFLFLLIFFSSPLFVICGFEIPENYEIRREYSGLISGPDQYLSHHRTCSEICLLTGKPVQISVVDKNDEFVYILFINGDRGGFKLPSAGSYVIKKNKLTGEIVQIKIFLNNDRETFVKIYPEAEYSKMEFFLYGSRIHDNVKIPVKFADIPAEPFKKIVSASSYMIDWDLMKGSSDIRGSRVVERAVRLIRERLPYIKDRDDGAQDEKGDFVFIETLDPQGENGGFNCSGFVKWISDGIWLGKRSSSGYSKLMDIDKLKIKNFGDRAVKISPLYEDRYDPCFGLDWTRNIAVAIGRLDDKDIGISDTDVRNYPYSPYVPDIGYKAGDIKALLYYLAVKDPGCIYLASVNGYLDNSRGLRRHYHVAVFMPYIDDDGNFVPVVMERNRETDIESFIGRYSGDEYIHLVKIKMSPKFRLP